MLVIILATILILAIAYFQVIQGLFSAAIMAILSVLCAAVALNGYEALSEAFLAARQGPYADPIALIALFILPLLVLRFASDRFLHGNAVFGTWADRIGGGALGIVSGMVLVGMLLIVMQMLPFGETIFGYRSHDATLQRDHQVMPFHPDEFTVGLVGLVSRGALSADASFEKLHDDLLLEAFCSRNTAGKHGGVRATPAAASVRAAYEPPAEKADWLRRAPKDARFDDAGLTNVFVVSVAVGESAADKDKWFRLCGTHFRLVAGPSRQAAKAKPRDDDLSDEALPGEEIDDSDDDAPAVRSYYPVGFLDLSEDKTKWVLHPAPANDDNQAELASLIVERKLPANRTTTVHWVYRIDQKLKPKYLVFRRSSRCKMPPFRKSVPKIPTPTIKKPPAKKSSAKKSSAKRR